MLQDLHEVSVDRHATAAETLSDTGAWSHHCTLLHKNKVQSVPPGLCFFVGFLGPDRRLRPTEEGVRMVMTVKDFPFLLGCYKVRRLGTTVGREELTL